MTLALLSGPAVGEPGECVKAGEETRTHLDIRISPVVDLHFSIRAAAAGPEDSVSTEGVAVQAVQEMNKALGGGLLAWGPVEGALLDCKTAADVLDSFGQLPETFGLRFRTPGKTVELRKHAVRYARALQDAEESFLEVTWPKHQSTLAALENRLDKGLAPKETDCFDYMIKHLGMEDPKITIPVFLVAEAPFPGAFTHRARGGRAVCFVSARDAAGSQLYETVLHEATHALDVATYGHNVFATLREKLSEAGLSRRDRGLRDVPHTLMFVHTAETVRRVLDPHHEHYGHVSGYYKKVPQATEAVLPPWTDYLDGKITQAAALDRIVQTFVKKRSQP